MLREVKHLFEKFDEDKSGSLEALELHEMFKKNGILLTMEELYKIFTIVDADSNGSLSLDEFSVYTYDPEAQKRFRDVIREVRKRFDIQINSKKMPDKPYIPSEFNALFSHLYNKTKHNHIKEHISDPVTSLLLLL